MRAENSNPTLSPAFRISFIVISIVLLAGASLFFLPDLGPGWFWHPAPFNRRFVGSVYLTEVVITIIMARTNRWAPARLILPGSLVFSALISAVSIIHFDQFDPTNVLRPVWFVLYFGSTPLFAYFLWRYRHLPTAFARPVLSAWRYYLLAQGSILNLYGLAELFFPVQTSAFWPWGIDEFHGRIYSAVFMTLGVSCYVLLRVAAPIEWFTLGVAQVTFAGFAMLGVTTVDAAVHRVNWAAPGVWLWFGAFAVLFLAGAIMLRQARQSSSAARLPAIKQGEA